MAFLLSRLPFSHSLVTQCFRKERDELTYEAFDVTTTTMLDEKPTLAAAADWSTADDIIDASLCEKMKEQGKSCSSNSFVKDSDPFGRQRQQQITDDAETSSSDVNDDDVDVNMKKETSSMSDRDNGNVARIEEFEILKLLGKGAYGKVYQVRKVAGSNSGRIFAMKAINKSSIVSSQTDLRHTKSERDVLVTVDHPFIVQLHYAFETKRRLYLVQVTFLSCLFEVFGKTIENAIQVLLYQPPP